MTTFGEPRRIVPADVDRVSGLIARAFAWHEPWGAWAMPDEADREQRMRDRVRTDLLERFITHGECWTIDCAVATIWFPPDVPELSRRRSDSDYEAYGEAAEGLRAGDALIASLRPSEPHWFLDTIATDPERFGEGLATRLLTHDLERRDAGGQVSALDTHTPRQVAFYERHGFRETGRGHLAPDLEVVVMVREPGAGP